MTPAARVAAAIEILEQIESAPAPSPSDHIASQYFRKRRYIGSGDRRAVGAMVFQVLRERLALDWLAESAGAKPGARAAVIAYLARDHGGAEIEALFNGDKYAPPQLEDAERLLLAPPPADAPDTARGNYPAWLEDQLVGAFGAETVAEMAAFTAPGTVDLRVNEGAVSRDEAIAALRGFGFSCEPTVWSPIGVRLAERAALTRCPLYRDGVVELQDEGAQIATLLGLGELTEAPIVIDYCAGAGGKTLALGARLAALAPEARLIACDVSQARLKRMAPRLERAGLDGVEFAVLDDGAAAWHAANAAIADRVLVDVPCSETGRWRRAPEGRSRLTETRLADMTRLQRDILDQAAALVKPGGWLTYITCSVLPRENDDQIRAFLDRHGDFSLLPIAAVWAPLFEAPCPAVGETLQLTPLRHGVDGFYIAILIREAVDSM